MSPSPIYRSDAGERALMALYDRALEAWPVPWEGLTIETRIGPTFVVAFGDVGRPPLVLLHGAAANSSMWAPAAPALARTFRVFAIDLPGEAGKSTPSRPPWKGPAFAEWLSDALDGLGLPRAMVAGISQGAWAALKLAATAPERIGRLALIAPAGVVPDRRSFVLRAIPCSFLGPWGARQITRMVLAPDPAPVAALDAAAFMNRHFRARVGIVPIFTDAELRAVTMPTLVVGGDRDALRDVGRIQRRLSPLLPHLECELIHDAGHASGESIRRAFAFLGRQAG